MLKPKSFFRVFVAVVLSVVLSVGVFGVVGCNRESAKEPKSGTSFQIGMVTFAGYAPLYLAKEKGFFGSLDVQLHRIEEIPSIRAAMEKGDLDAYLATLDIALDTNAKPPGVAVWALDESSGGDGVIVAENISDLAGLKGKKVAAEPGLPPNFILLYLLHKNNLALSDIQFQDMSTQDAATAFASKSIDAAGIYEPYLSTSKNQRAGSKIVLSSADTPGLIVDLIFVRQDRLESRKKDVEVVIAGWRKAVEFIRQSPDEAYTIMAKAYGLSVPEFKDIAGGVKWLDAPENTVLFGTPSSPGPLYQNFAVVGDVLRRNRSTVYQAKPEEHLTRGFVSEVK